MLKIKINKENDIFVRLEKLASSLEETVNQLDGVFKGLKDNNEDVKKFGLVKIKTIYERTAMIREEIMSILYSEAFLPDFKESMVNLTYNIYNAIKAAKDSATAINSRTPARHCIDNLSNDILEYLSLIKEATQKMKLMISLIPKDLQEAVKVGKEIQMLERAGDEIKDSILRKLYDMEQYVDLLSLLQMKDIVLFMDDILDEMEEATISVEIFLATLKA
ncbi:MAG: DUF47 family protein [Sulfolobaceae archaeon]|nr:DUF47 family protein [Sulfolobaceae archaeon]